MAASRAPKADKAIKPTGPTEAPAQPAPAASAPAPVAQPEPQPAQPAPERQFAVEIRLDSSAVTGESAYHVTWSESYVRRVLTNPPDWVPVPPRAHLPGQAAPAVARFVYIQAIAEIIIAGWPQDDLG
jgi:hypothetical protein